jgi:hypothetical protein
VTFNLRLLIKKGRALQSPAFFYAALWTPVSLKESLLFPIMSIEASRNQKQNSKPKERIMSLWTLACQVAAENAAEVTQCVAEILDRLEASSPEEELGLPSAAE